MKYPYQCCKHCVFDSLRLSSDSANYLGVVYGLRGTTSQGEINAVGVVLLIAQGWRQPTLGYVCCEEVNAVGVVLFPGLSKVQRLQRYAMRAFIMADVFIGILAHFAIYLFACCP